ncbi:MAG: PASTA domain-containing protein [Ruminococcus sp.]|nr:PASTA domain-containing protein [Ruminococcus sp.]
MFRGGAHKHPAFIYLYRSSRKEDFSVINTNPSKAMKFRTKFVMTAVFSVLFVSVAANFFKISVLDNKTYQDMANNQHFASMAVSAHRGSIYDSKGVVFAKSATVYTVFVDPKQFNADVKSLQSRIDKRNLDKASGKYVPKFDEEGNELDVLPASAEEFVAKATEFISIKLEIAQSKFTSAINAEGQYRELKGKVEKATVDEINEFFDSMGFISIGYNEDTKRYYPQDDLAASVVGYTNGNVYYGIEASYNKYLSGVDGRTISAKDSHGNALPYKYSKTYDPQDGSDVYLTIDREIQYILEKYLKEMTEENYVKNRSCAILMNPKTGAILGMAQYPSFNLNDPRELNGDMLINKVYNEKNIYSPTEKEKEDAEAEAVERQLRNKCVSERYEPGSVFKIITAASTLEEKTIDTDTWSHYCRGVETFKDGQRELEIHCHKLPPGHGMRTFQEALTDSCNPAFMELGKLLGIEKFHSYFEAFGFAEETGIDLPAEAVGDIPPIEDTEGRKAMTHIDLAYSAFGQCETVTPIELITACSAAINGGYLLQPYVVDRVVDGDGNIVLKNERTVRRQVISEDTSTKMRQALRTVVEDNPSGNVDIKGYAIGGKSGTSERRSEPEVVRNLNDNSVTEGNSLEYGASYVCFTPADDPELILLVLADMPDNSPGAYYGSKCAVPCAEKILKEILPYLGMSPEYNEEELKNRDINVPLLTGASIDDAKKTLDEMGIRHVEIGNGIEVVEQSPQTGKAISKDGCVYLYTEKYTESEKMVKVPYLIGCSPEVANQSIYLYELNYTAKGVVSSQSGSYVKKQSYEAGTYVPKGTTIELEFETDTFTD